MSRAGFVVSALVNQIRASNCPNPARGAALINKNMRNHANVVIASWPHPERIKKWSQLTHEQVVTLLQAIRAASANYPIDRCYYRWIG